MTDRRRQQLEMVLTAYEDISILASLRSKSPLVPPSGPVDSPIVLVGEAPGADEVIKLAPFVGRAGQLLRQYLRRAGLGWDQLYVTNTVLYRPPGNRTPYPFEVQASLQRLMSELAIVRPVVVVTLGATAWSALGNPSARYSEARGKWHQLKYDLALPPADLLVTWHPAAALRDRIADRELAEHLTMILRNTDDSNRGAPSGAAAT